LFSKRKRAVAMFEGKGRGGGEEEALYSAPEKKRPHAYFSQGEASLQDEKREKGEGKGRGRFLFPGLGRGRKKRPCLTKKKEGKKGLRLPLSPQKKREKEEEKIIPISSLSRRKVLIIWALQRKVLLFPFGGGEDYPDHVWKKPGTVSRWEKDAKRAALCYKGGKGGKEGGEGKRCSSTFSIRG